MKYEAQNFDRLLGANGFSDELLKNHFALYQGYVLNTNKIIESLGNMAKDGKAGVPEYNELKRRFGWEFNGMRLHEYYFENMLKDYGEIDRNSKLFKKIESDFGNYENWEKDFKSVGAIRGIGWAILYYDRAGDKLFNVWVNEHDLGHFSGAVPVLVMDVFEHAYIRDYGLKRADYIEAFFKALNWKVIEERFV